MDRQNVKNWRELVPDESRKILVKRIMDTAQRCRELMEYGRENLDVLLHLALDFEGTVYLAAVSERHYLQEISLGMLAKEKQASRSLQITQAIEMAPATQNQIAPALSDIHMAQAGMHAEGQIEKFPNREAPAPMQIMSDDYLRNTSWLRMANMAGGIGICIAEATKIQIAQAIDIPDMAQSTNIQDPGGVPIHKI